MMLPVVTDGPWAELDGPSRTIVVEPIETPMPRELPAEDPAPDYAPTPEREPEKVPA